MSARGLAFWPAIGNACIASLGVSDCAVFLQRVAGTNIACSEGGCGSLRGASMVRIAWRSTRHDEARVNLACCRTESACGMSWLGRRKGMAVASLAELSRIVGKLWVVAVVSAFRCHLEFAQFALWECLGCVSQASLFFRSVMFESRTRTA